MHHFVEWQRDGFWCCIE